MYVNRVSFESTNLQNRRKLPNFKGSLNKTMLNHNNIVNSSVPKTKNLLQSVIDFFKKLLNPNKNLEQVKEVDVPVKNIKPSETEIRKLLNIPENGVIIRNGYEEHYQGGKIVKKVLCPEAYAEHTRIVDAQVEYLYNGDELKEIRKYDTINDNEVMRKRIFTNLGDISVAQIRDL